MSSIPHLLSLYPLLVDKSLEETREILRKFNISLEDIDILYLQYCLNAFVHEKRDYNLLRDYLKQCIVGCYDFKEKIAEFNIYPEVIYDIGAGHTGYADVYSKIWPKATIHLVDKILIDTNKYDVIMQDAFKFTELRNNKGNDKTLIFLSEFLHCKKENRKLLDEPFLLNSHVIVNEQIYDPFLNERLKMSGGECFSYTHFSYDAGFRYKMREFEYYIALRRARV